MKQQRFLAVVVLGLMVALPLAGCGGFRFVIDVVPAVDTLRETTVLEDRSAGWGADKVAMIDVTGVLSNGDAGLNPLSSGENPVGRLAESLRKAAEDRRVRAVVLHVNSPGGTVTASDLMYRELKHFKAQTGKPIVVLMSDLAASGGYYISMAGDELIANPTTVTGSIGVIMQTFNVSEGMKRIGIQAEAITSGPNKAVGSPWAPMSTEHRALLQGIVNEMYATFRGVVVANRPDLDGPGLEEITDGRVITGAAAFDLGVVDALGDYRDAFAAAKRRAGITTAKLVKYHRPTKYVGSAYAQGPGGGAAPAAQVNLLQLNVENAGAADASPFLYLWDPAAW